jgi:multidrug efflux pump subunit AcrB
MKISEFSVKNYQFTLVVFLAVLSIGIFSLLKMPRGEDPEFESPSFSVIVVYPGTNPYDMEKLVVDPLERKINELENINQVITTMYDGVAAFRVEYFESEDADAKYQELVREISAIRKDLPADILDIRIQKFTPTDVNIYQWALISENLPYKQLQKHAEELENRMSKVLALKNIDSWGYPKQKVSVELNLAKMAQDKIPLNRVLGAIQSENVNIPGGSINIAAKKFNVKTSGEYKSLDEIKNTIVFTNGTKIVLLKDVADVSIKYENETHITRLNGHRCVFVTVGQKENQNIIEVSQKVDPIFDQFKAELPKTVDAVKVFDQPQSVNTRLSRFAKDFGIAILLVLVTLLPLGTRASIIVMISIPLSLAIGLTLLYAFGFTINQLSIVGMILALGILVDDSIVVVENIERFMRQGSTRKQAAIDATKQISLAVIGCTMLLCFAFLPVAFLPESSGKFIRSLPMSVIFTVLASMVVSLTIVPFLASALLKENHNPEGNAIMRVMKKGISLTYGKLMNWSLRNPWLTISGAIAVFVGVMVVAKFYLGFSLFPSSEKPMFLINIETPVGSNLSTTKNVVSFVEKELKKWPEIKFYSTNIGMGNPRIYYNEIPRNEQENYAQIFVQLEDDAENIRKKEIITILRGNLSSYPNAKIKVNNFEQGPPLNAPIAYRILGENLDTMKIVAAKIEKILTDHPGTIYIENPLKVLPTDLKIKINKEKAGLLAVNISDIDRAVRMGIAGLNLGTFRMADEKDEININVTVPNTSGVAGYEVFNSIYVNSALGTAIPLKQLTEVVFETSPNEIRHLNKDRYVMISSYLKNGFNTNQVNSEIVEKLKNFKFPKGFSYKVSGEAENAEKSFGGIGVIVIITIFGMISILILEFGNFKSTLIVLSVIPLGIVGAILMLLLWGETMSFTAVVGFIALIGIEVKNSLLLVDYTNQLREEGMALDAAIKEAGEVRFVPILLTSLTAIGGLTPLVIEYSDLYSPLALVLIGGIISSTLLSRLVTPVMYKLLPPKVELKNV